MHQSVNSFLKFTKGLAGWFRSAAVSKDDQKLIVEGENVVLSHKLDAQLQLIISSHCDELVLAALESATTGDTAPTGLGDLRALYKVFAQNKISNLDRTRWNMYAYRRATLMIQKARLQRYSDFAKHCTG